MSESKYSFEAVTKEVINLAMEVHSALGPGFQEFVYQRALFYEMKSRNMDFSREPEIKIFYKGNKVGERRVDFMVEDCLVEIKAKQAFEDCDFIQTLSYLRASGRKVALLLNFGTKKLEIKRFVNSKTEHPSYN